MVASATAGSGASSIRAVALGPGRSILFLCLLGFHGLDLLHLLVRVGSNELFNHHVPASYSDHQLPIHDLSEDLFGPEQIVAIAKSLDGYRTLGHIDVLS